MEIDAGTGVPVRRFRVVRAHVFLCVMVAALLLGAGLRLVPTDASAASGSDTAGDGPAAPTACAAR